MIWTPEVSAAVGDQLGTPDISSIVNEITAMPGWLSGNSLAILFGHISGASSIYEMEFVTLGLAMSESTDQFG